MKIQLRNLFNLLICSMFMTFSNYAQSIDSDIVDIPQQQAEFKGGIRELQNYIDTHLFTESTLYEGNIKTGSVYVKLIIDKQGKVINSEILKSLNESTDNAVLKLTRSMPLWNPAINNGVPVKSRFIFPVKINEDFSAINIKKERCFIKLNELNLLNKDQIFRKNFLLGYSIRMDNRDGYSQYYTCNKRFNEILKSTDYLDKDERVTSILFNKNSKETILVTYDSLNYANVVKDIRFNSKKYSNTGGIEWFINGKDFIGIKTIYRKLTVFEKNNLVTNFIADKYLINSKDKKVEEYKREIETIEKPFYWEIILTNKSPN